MKNFLNTKVKDMKAITLIALVITIVVLIILAAVAINLSLGNNGIFNRAKTAKEQYANATQYEQTEVGKATNQIDSYVGGYRGFSPISYSEEEQDTGLTWIDGKKIYQKTIVSNTGSGNASVSITDLNLETLVEMSGAVKQTSGGKVYWSPLFYNGANSANYMSSAFIAVDDKVLRIVTTNGYYNFPVYINIQYTKTTD